MSEMLDVLGAPMIVKRDEGLFVAEHPIPPGYFVPPHVHAEDDEMLYVLEGELTLIDDAGERPVGPGGFVRFRPGARHGFRNDSPGTVKLLVLAQPGFQAAEMFRHFDRAARATALAPARVVTIAAEYGVRFG